MTKRRLSLAARKAISVPAALAMASCLALAFAAPASADHGPDAPGGPYSGFSTGSAIHIDALTNASTRAVDVEVGVANAAVNSEGLDEVVSEYRRTIVPDGIDTKHSRGHSTVAEVGVGLSPPEAENQIKPWVAEANAPGGENVDKSAVNQSVGPVAFVDLLHNEARAKWNSDTCVIGEPISMGAQHLARVDLLETGDDEDTPAKEGFDQPLAGLNANQAGPPRATTHILTKQQLFLAGNGPQLGLQSVASATVAPITFFKGTANEFTLELDGPAVLSASATGRPGGANLFFRAPVVAIIQQGKITTAVPGSEIVVRQPAGDAIAEVRVSSAQALATPKGLGGTRTESADGTRAAAEVNVVQVKLLDVASQNLRGATIGIGHMEAAATVPAGGIECPLPVTKDANPDEVSVGDTFTTTITIFNRFACPLTNVSLTDVITTESGARFEVTGTTPAASTPSGSGLSTGTVRWANLGRIDPGKSLSVTVTLEAQGSAGRILDTATAGGTLDNCPAGEASEDGDVTALAKADVDVDGRATLVVPESRVLGATFLPQTGVGDVATSFAGLMLIALGAAGGLALRRTRA